MDSRCGSDSRNASGNVPLAAPYELSVTEAAVAVRRRQLSPVELVQSLLDRIDALDGQLVAWATVVPDQALAAAREAERTAAESPLHGVPFGAKDIFDTAGIRTAAGSKIWADRVPDKDASSVALLKGAGAVLLGKTHTTEFADGDPAPSRNPWDAECTPGGSSTGSAVAVASRMVPFALGTQTVGSVLRPAAYNGVVGFKPTFGRISRLGVVPLAPSFDHVGVLVRTVQDAAAVLDVLAGHDAADPDSADAPAGGYAAALETGAPPRIGLVRTWYLDEADAETRLRMEEVAQELARAGAVVDEVEPGIDFADAYAKHRLMMESETAATHETLYTGSEHLYGPKLTAYIRRGREHTAEQYVLAGAYREPMRALAKAALEKVDVLLMPTASGPPPRDLTQTGDTRFQSAWSYLGFPSISIPMGLASSALPLGAQLACGPFQEAKLLRAARWAEQALGVTLSPPV